MKNILIKFIYLGYLLSLQIKTNKKKAPLFQRVKKLAN